MNYYLWISGQEHGPHTLEQIQQSIDDGDINTLQTARTEDSSDWKPLHQIARLKHPTPKRQPAKQTMPGATQTTAIHSAPASGKRVKEHLNYIRSITCYKTLRTVIECSFVICLLAAALSTVFSVVNQQGIATAFLGILGMILLVAIRQSALLIIDIADTLLHEHAKDKKQ